MNNNQDLEPEAEEILKAGKIVADSMSAIPALYSIAISLKRIADAMTHVPTMTVGPELDKIIDTELKNWNPGVISK